MLIEITYDIKKALKSLPFNAGGKKADSIWTYKLKKGMLEVGKKYSLSAHTPGIFEEFDYSNGWLYDLVLYKENNSVIDELILCMESQWQPDFKEIKYDFEKLLIARSQIRLMVFQADEKKVEEYFEQLTDLIETSSISIKGDAYILACVQNNNGRIFVREYRKGLNYIESYYPIPGI